MAARQHGVITRQQLVALGLGEGAIEYRVRLGRLCLLHRGVYALAYVPRSPHARSMAAVLTCGAAAVLSHRSAAVLWGFLRSFRGPVEVTAAQTHRRAGVIVHRSRGLTRSDVSRALGIPVTSPVRTLIDLADALDDLALARAVNEARLSRHVRLEQIAERLESAPGRRAVARLRPLIGRGDGPTRSRLEREFLSFCERQGFPRPQVNRRIIGYEVDMLWPAERVVVELDGRWFHDDPGAFERDREKDAALTVAGYRVMRVTWRRLMERPQGEATRLRVLLALDAA